MNEKQRQAAAEAVAEFYLPPCKKDGEYAKQCRISIMKFIEKTKLTDQEIQEARDRIGL